LKRIVVRLDDDLHQRLRIMSVERGKPIQHMLLNLIQREVDRYEARRPPRSRESLSRADLAAIRRGLADIRGGRVVPWESLLREIEE
jgi:predicted transcriptional regulator